MVHNARPVLQLYSSVSAKIHHINHVSAPGDNIPKLDPAYRVQMSFLDFSWSTSKLHRDERFVSHYAPLYNYRYA